MLFAMVLDKCNGYKYYSCSKAVQIGHGPISHWFIVRNTSKKSVFMQPKGCVAGAAPNDKIIEPRWGSIKLSREPNVANTGGRLGLSHAPNREPIALAAVADSQATIVVVQAVREVSIVGRRRPPVRVRAAAVERGIVVAA